MNCCSSTQEPKKEVEEVFEQATPVLNRFSQFSARAISKEKSVPIKPRGTPDVMKSSGTITFFPQKKSIIPPVKVPVLDSQQPVVFSSRSRGSRRNVSDINPQALYGVQQNVQKSQKQSKEPKKTSKDSMRQEE